MSTNNTSSNNDTVGTTGEGTRPATAGGVDNMGAASSFTPHSPLANSLPGAAGDLNAPAPREKMAEKSQDGANADTARNPGPRKDGD